MRETLFPAKTQRVRWIRHQAGGVVCDPLRHRYYRLNAPALHVWELCDGVTDIRGIACSLSRRYRVSIPRALRDVCALIAQWQRRALVCLYVKRGRFFPERIP